MSHATHQPDLPVLPDADDPLDDEWGERPSRRLRPRVVLLALLALSLCFLGGVEVQRRLGSASTSEASASGFPSGFDPASLPGGVPPQGSGLPGGAGTGADASGDGGTESDETLLIGTVVSVSGNRWTVEDLGGATHVVRVGEDTRVSRTREVERGSVRSGDEVTVSGTPTSGDAGTTGLSATSVTLR